MLGEIIAIISGSLWAANHVATRKGLSEGGSTMAAVYIGLSTNVMILWPVALFFTDLSQVGPLGLGFLVMAGIFGSLLGRLMRAVSIGKLGVAGSEPIISSSPLFAALIATTMRAEEMTLVIAIGTLLIVFGVVMTSEGQWRINKIGVAASLATAILFAFGENFRKLGIDEVGSPTFSAVIAASVGFTASFIYFKGRNPFRTASGSSKKTFLYGGFTTTGALLTAFIALSLADVVVVVPLFSTSSLFALLFARIFLRRQEKITLRIVMSVLLVISGTVLIVAR